MIPSSLLGLALAVGLSCVHVFVGRSHWLDKIPNRLWTSFSGGISIAYIFLSVFPELSLAQAEIEHTNAAFLAYLENHVYLLSLAGLAIFYGLEKLALSTALATASTLPRIEASEATTEVAIGQSERNESHADGNTLLFYIHILSFAVYNAILGYLFRESANHGVVDCLILFVALGLHFAVNDFSLRHHYPYRYDHIGRWILSGAIFSGWSLGQTTHFNAAAVAAVWALVAGGVIMNVLKEELPEERTSHFGYFVVGAAFYAVILLMT